MSAPSEAFGGRCLCGASRFVAEGVPDWVGICHCESCRRATGGALVAAAGFKRVKVVLTGESLTGFASSPGVTRTFCSVCGTSLAYQNARWPHDIHLMAGAFDEPQRLRPGFHLFWDHRLPWLCLADDLPRYRSTPGGPIAEP